jgi:hypothetical protein
MLTGIGEEQLGSGHGLPLPRVADVAGIEEVRPRKTEVREPGFGLVMVDAEALGALETIRSPAIDAFPAKFPLEMRLVGTVLFERTRIGTPLLAFDWEEQHIQKILHLCLGTG